MLCHLCTWLVRDRHSYNGNIVYRMYTGVSHSVLFIIRAEHHLVSREPRALLRQAYPRSLLQGLNSKAVSSQPACVWMDSLCSSSSWHWASGRRTLLLIFPFVFLSPLSLGLKTNGKKRKGGWEQRNGLETLAGRLEGRETSVWFMLSVWLKVREHRTNADMPSVCFGNLVSCTTYSGCRGEGISPAVDSGVTQLRGMPSMWYVVSAPFAENQFWFDELSCSTWRTF